VGDGFEEDEILLHFKFAQILCGGQSNFQQ
jgi:hypothetical protein